VTGAASAIERSVLCLLNRERARRSLRPLRRSPDLDRASRRHSRDMVRRGYFSHKRDGGPNFVERIRRTGYLDGVIRWTVGENIAFGGGSRSAPASLVKGWMASPGHKANILSRTFKEIGLGLATGSPYERGASGPAVTITTDFGFRTRR
jgi:uncharacterized protein YkwD